MQNPSDVKRPDNRILAALDRDSFQRLEPHLKLISIPTGQSLWSVGERIGNTYFFTGSAMCSLVNDSEEEDTSVEVGMVGRDGFAGIGILFGTNEALHSASIQVGGRAYRLNYQHFKAEFKRSGSFQTLTLKYADTLVKQISQTALCNSVHTIEKRFARWLLASHDYVEGDTVTITQLVLSKMLGADRARVAVVASAFQSAGLIKTRSGGGEITLLNRKGLEAITCPCYREIKRYAEKVFANK